jgi:hypothetical protein
MIVLLSEVLSLIVVEVWSGIKRKDGYVVSPNTLAYNAVLAKLWVDFKG